MDHIKSKKRSIIDNTTQYAIRKVMPIIRINYIMVYLQKHYVGVHNERATSVLTCCQPIVYCIHKGRPTFFFLVEIY